MSLALLALAFALLMSSADASQDSLGIEIRTMIAQARHPWARRPDFPRHVDLLARLYASRGDAPVPMGSHTRRGMGCPSRDSISC
jgi:hypothetical protein